MAKTNGHVLHFEIETGIGNVIAIKKENERETTWNETHEIGLNHPRVGLDHLQNHVHHLFHQDKNQLKRLKQVSFL